MQKKTNQTKHTYNKKSNPNKQTINPQKNPKHTDLAQPLQNTKTIKVEVGEITEVSLYMLVIADYLPDFFFQETTAAAIPSQSETFFFLLLVLTSVNSFRFSKAV